jgi:DMSO reductase anchor subunit
MNLPELPLVFFTLLTQMAVGLALVAALGQWLPAGGPTGTSKLSSKTQLAWATVLGLLAVGVIAAFFHLGRPTGAVRMLSNLGTAWLSREILAFVAFGVLAAVTVAAAYRGSLNRWLALATALVGALAVLATGMTYAAPSLVAIYNGLPLVFFGLTALILGASIGSYFVPPEKQSLLVSVLGYSLAIALVVYLVIPFVWLSGGGVMAMSGQAFLASPVYWARLALGLAVPLAVVWWMKKIPAWLPPVLILGELAARVIFFALIVSSAVNLGGIY